MDSTDLGSSLAIVAIPSQEDYVWNVSSEKVPHMTLLFLGDQSKNPNVDHIVDFVQHVVNASMYRFGLSVDRRGTLGPKDADVLFFENNYWTKMISQARGYFLQDPYIKIAYDSVEQYPDWTPHLTLGYPETPAKRDERDYPGFSWVNFDRIAVWTGDYEGPTFDLKRRNSLEMKMSDRLEESLEHHGVKGMKWGVRRDRGHEGQRAKTSKIAKLDRKFEKRASTFGTEMTLYNQAARRMNEFEIDRINRKPEYRNANLNRDTPISRKYEKEMSDAFLKHLKQAATDIGTNASGTKKYDIHVRSDGGWDVSVVDVKHADGSFVVKVIRDDTGHITSLVIDDNSLMLSSSRDIVDVMAQSDETVSEFLTHIGVKGMRWGIRQKSSSEHDSEDAKAATEAAQKVKKHGTSSLTNKELQQLVNRMNLEQQFNRLTPDSKGKAAAKFAKDILVDVGKEQAKNLARQAAAKQVAKFLASSIK